MDAINKAVDQNDIEYTDKRAEEEFCALKDILGKAHAITKAKIKVEKVNKALESNEKGYKIAVLIENIAKYEKFINLLQPITGRWVTHDENFYVDRSIDMINIDLKLMNK